MGQIYVLLKSPETVGRGFGMVTAAGHVDAISLMLPISSARLYYHK
jgi:hypothetical protein